MDSRAGSPTAPTARTATVDEFLAQQRRVAGRELGLILAAVVGRSCPHAGPQVVDQPVEAWQPGCLRSPHVGQELLG